MTRPPGPGDVGLLGGTFNPVHLGHLRVAEEIAESLSLPEVILMPAAAPPHKSSRGLASFKARLAMLRLAAREREGFTVSDLEGRLSGPSYTVNSLRALRAELGPGRRVFFFIGFDSFKNVGLWRECRELFKLATFVVFRRPGARGGREALGLVLSAAAGGSWRWDEASESYLGPGGAAVRYFRQESRLEISSTALRRRLLEGRSVRYLVPEVVRRYIETRGLYREG